MRKQITVPISCTVSIALVALLLSGASTMAATASAGAPEFAQTDESTIRSLGETLSQCFLPLVSNEYCPAARAVASPFSVEIAAIHQIEPTYAESELMLYPGARSGFQSSLLALSDEAFDALVDALVESGAGWARVRIAWGEMQPNPPPAPYQKLSWYDQRLAQVAGTGVRMIVTVADAPEWAAERACAPIYADRLDEFAEFLGDLVNRYKGPPYNVTHWELMNEPDGSWSGGWTGGLGCWADENTDEDGRRFAQMLAMASWAIKDTDPGAKVLMGGVAHDWFTEYGGPFDRYFPDDVMAHGGGGYIDALNMHYFPDFRAEWERWVPGGNPPTCGILDDGKGTAYEAWGIDLIAKANHFRNRLSTCYGVDKPLWVTELAEHGYAGKPESLARQARYVIQGYARGLAAGVENITWYALVTPNDTYEQGLLYEDWTPKPAFYAYQTLTTELKGYEYAYTLDVQNIEGYVFRNPCGREKTAAWGSGTLTVAPARRLRVMDRSGNAIFVQDSGAGDLDGAVNGSVQLQLSSEPVFVTASP